MVRAASEGIAAAKKALDKLAADGFAKISQGGAKNTIKFTLRMHEPLEFDFKGVRTLRVLSADGEQVVLSACLKQAEGESPSQYSFESMTSPHPSESRQSGAINNDDQISDKTGDQVSQSLPNGKLCNQPDAGAAPAPEPVTTHEGGVGSDGETGAKEPANSGLILEPAQAKVEEQADDVQTATSGIEDPQPEPASGFNASNNDHEILAIATWEALMTAEGVPLTAKVPELRKHGDEVERLVRPDGKDLTRIEVFGDLSEFVRQAYGRRLASLKSKAGKFRLRALHDNATAGATVIEVFRDAAGAACLVGRGTTLSDGAVSPVLVFAPKNADGRDFVFRAPKNSKCLGIPMITLIRENSVVQQSVEAAE